jgi:hypothetical protein
MNLGREIRGRETTGRVSKEDFRARLGPDRSDEFRVSRQSLWIVEVPAEFLVGGVNAFKAFFSFEAHALIMLEAIRMPALRGSAIRFVDRRLRGRRLCNAEGP